MITTTTLLALVAAPFAEVAFILSSLLFPLLPLLFALFLTTGFLSVVQSCSLVSVGLKLILCQEEVDLHFLLRFGQVILLVDAHHLVEG